jgi:short-subunit dehydrogenase
MSVVITGATGGVGEELARLYSSKGYDLILMGRDGKNLEILATDLASQTGVSVRTFSFDVLNLSEISETIKAINSTKEKIDLLINVAGVFPYGPIMKTDDDDYDNCMNVNVRFPLLLSRGMYSKLADGGGKVINIGSSSSYGGFKNTVLYCASKHALLGLSRALNDEWKADGITVHCVSPGTIDTKMATVLDQDSTTYINAKEFAQLVYDVGSYNGNMMVDEVRAVRRVIR